MAHAEVAIFGKNLVSYDFFNPDDLCTFLNQLCESDIELECDEIRLILYTIAGYIIFFQVKFTKEGIDICKEEPQTLLLSSIEEVYELFV